MKNFTTLIDNTDKTINNGLHKISYYIMQDLINFTKFILVDNNIIKLAIALLTATQVTNISSIIVDNLISPIVYKIISYFTNETSQEMSKATYTYMGIEFQLGLFIVNMIKFIIVLILIYNIYSLSLPVNSERVLRNMIEFKDSIKK
jgi:large-conductance mechanosensitive channel